MAKQRIGEVLLGYNLRTMGGWTDGYLQFSNTEADGYVNTAASVLDNLEVEGDGSGVYTFTFKKLFPRVLSVSASPVLTSAAARKVDVVSFSQTGFVLRWANSSSGAATHPSAVDGITFHIMFQNSMVNTDGTYGNG